MAMTYGERMLADAEARARGRTAGRRRLVLLTPTVVAILWALADLVAARAARFDAGGAGLFQIAIGLIAPVVWTVLFVLAPAVASLKRDPLPAGAALAFLAGPCVSPLLFGPGGWRWWQIAAVSAMTVLVIGGAVARARTITLD